MRVLRLGPEGADEAFRDRIDGPLFVLADEPWTAERLRAAGLSVTTGAEPPDGCTLVLGIASPLDGLAHLTDRLLGPGGCPWDQEQTHETLKKYLLEEVYEVFEAIDTGDRDHFREELGDLLLQPFLNAQISARDGGFSIQDVAQTITDKLIRRHPHVFGNVVATDTEAVLRNWAEIKRLEKKEGPLSTLDGVPPATPALFRALQISKRAAKQGFEWPDYASVLEKLREELAELEEAVAGGDPARIEAELGDVLFTVVNLARWQRIDPEESLRKMLARFERRYRRMESLVEGPLADLTSEAWEQLWQMAKSDVG